MALAAALGDVALLGIVVVFFATFALALFRALGSYRSASARERGTYVPPGAGGHGRKGWGVVALVVVAGLYLNGTFDHALYPVGLNAKDCARNGFGATFCGEELDEYNYRVRSLPTYP